LIDEALRQVEVRNQTGSGIGEPVSFGEQDTIVSKMLPGFGVDVKALLLSDL
jgi:hypothetical protein